jgi:hypothetical protein
MMKPDTQAACEAAKRALETARAAIFAEAETSIAHNEAPDLVRFYADMREELEALAGTISEFNKLDKDLSYSRIPACFDAHGLQNIKLPGYGLVGLNRRWSCSILDKPKGYKYLRDNGQAGMIIETVNAATLGAWAREEVEDKGIEPPDDVFKTSIARYVSLTRSK